MIATAQADTVFLTPVADATIFSLPDCPDGVPNTECGAGTGVRLYVGNTTSFGERRSLLRFNLAGIPAGAQITSATLTLELFKSHATPSDVTISRVLQSWTEGPTNFAQGVGAPAQAGDVTWTQRTYLSSPAQPWTTPGGDMAATTSATLSVSGAVGPYVWSSTRMTADVQGWVNQPAANFGWELIGSGSAEAYGSRESTAPPRLTVVYTPAPPPASGDVPLPAWALGALVMGLGRALSHQRAYLALPWLLPALLALAWPADEARANDLAESVIGDLSNDHLAPTLFTLGYGVPGANGDPGNNVLSGTVGRDAQGVIDRDYVHIVVPQGYVLTQLKVGNQTTVGGSGSFIGLGLGSSISIDPNTVGFTSPATGLLGYRIYTTADRGTNILDAMATVGNGASGFERPLAAGDYTLWIQELSSGSYTYRFNLVTAPVPEPETDALLIAGLLLVAAARRSSARAAG